MNKANKPAHYSLAVEHSGKPFKVHDRFGLDITRAVNGYFTNTSIT